MPLKRLSKAEGSSSVGPRTVSGSYFVGLASVEGYCGSHLAWVGSSEATAERVDGLVSPQ